MKVLSDNTADKLLRLLSGDGTPQRRMTPRAAPTLAPALMWQIHVTSAGVVTVDGGDVYHGGERFTLAASEPGTADGNALVIWTAGTGGGSITLATSLSGVTGDFRVLGAIVKDDAGRFTSRQFVGEPIETGSSAIHYGDAEGATTATSWSIADGTPAILDIGRAKVLVDSRGNVISWNASSGGGEGGDEPADPEAPTAPPPCGNPLNDTEEEDYNPLDPTDDDSDDYNPLNYEGPGGYTPKCDLEAT